MKKTWAKMIALSVLCLLGCGLLTGCYTKVVRDDSVEAKLNRSGVPMDKSSGSSSSGNVQKSSSSSW